MSLCAVLHDETENCKTLDLYDDDEISFEEMLQMHFLIFLAAVVVMAIICRFIAKSRYEQKLTQKIGEYVTEYQNMQEDAKLKN